MSLVISQRLISEGEKTPFIVQAAPGSGKADMKCLRWSKAVTGDQGLEPGQGSK